jgi:hypothetical protein
MRAVETTPPRLFAVFTIPVVRPVKRPPISMAVDQTALSADI